ncbi:MAG: antibiotic biosynthesis monooxygenase [Actinomycetota bacterium]|nr:antibiotic biosynthesis monooxygenase [Actinomycetota bacterium]
MIFIVVKFTVRPDRTAEWLSLVQDFTEATRAEEGNNFFEWSRSVDDPDQFVLVEAFRDAEAGTAHVNSEHFKAAMAWMPDVVARKPDIVNVEVAQDGWGQMGEINPRQ